MVICKPTGFIFDKDSFMKHFSVTPTCPITGVPLEEQDLVDIKSPIEVDEQE